MTEQTQKLVRETRRRLARIDTGRAAFGIFPISVLLTVLYAIGMSVTFDDDMSLVASEIIGVAIFFTLCLFALVWTRRAWLLSRAAFEVAADGIDTDAPASRVEAAPRIEVDGAIVKGVGTLIGIVIVKPEVTIEERRANRYRDWLREMFPEFETVQLILAYREPTGAYTYQGRPDIVDFLVEVDANDIPWQRYVCQ